MVPSNLSQVTINGKKYRNVAGKLMLAAVADAQSAEAERPPADPPSEAEIERMAREYYIAKYGGEL